MNTIYEERNKYGPNGLLRVREGGTRHEELATHLDYEVGQTLDDIRAKDDSGIVIEVGSLIALL